MTAARTSTREWPVSYAQRALWLLHRLDPTSPAYHTGAAVLVHAHLDPAALESAVARLALRHDMLRSTFVQAGGQVLRRIHAEPPIRPVVVRAGGTAPLTAQPPRWAVAAARDVLTRPFTLADGAFRFVAVRPDDPAEPWLLVMAAHHIATDALSNWVLLRDLFTMLAGPATDGLLPPPPSATYQDFVERETRLLTGDTRPALERYWRAVCTGAVAAGPAPGRPGAQATGRGATHRMRLGAACTTALRQAAAACEVTLFAFLLACLQAVVGPGAGGGPFLVACPTSLRTGRAFREVVGNFVNTLVFRAEVTARTSVRDLAVAAQRQVVEGIRAGGLPFSLLPALMPQQTGPRRPLCRLTFNLIGTTAAEPLLCRLLDPEGGTGPVEHLGLPLTPVLLPQSEGQVDLAVHAQQSRDGVTLEFRYDVGLLAPATVSRIAKRYRALLESASADPDRAARTTDREEVPW